MEEGEKEKRSRQHQTSQHTVKITLASNITAYSRITLHQTSQYTVGYITANQTQPRWTNNYKNGLDQLPIMETPGTHIWRSMYCIWRYAVRAQTCLLSYSLCESPMMSMTSDIIPFYAHTWRSLSVEPATQIWAVLAICLGHIWILLVWHVVDVASMGITI